MAIRRDCPIMLDETPAHLPKRRSRKHLMRQYELVERVRAYDPNADEDLLNRAYVFSMQAHGTQMRASGDPYFSHPLEVAGILTDMKMDSTTIATALLHDTVEDTLASLEDIQKQFGPDVARLVDGVTKLSRIELQTDQASRRKISASWSWPCRRISAFCWSSSRTVCTTCARCIISRIPTNAAASRAKRWRSTRRWPSASASRRCRTSWKIWLSPSFIPTRATASSRASNFLRSEGGDIVEKILEGTWPRFWSEAGITAEIEAAKKRPIRSGARCSARTWRSSSCPISWRSASWSTYVEQCYQVLGVIHSRYPVVPGRFKDYISTPKPNQYQSLHTGIIGPERQRIEIQIRTPRHA